MSDERQQTDADSSEDSRRSFLKKSAVASGALALGGAATGNAAAQTDDGTETETPTDGAQQDGDTVLMLYNEAVPNAGITVESGAVDWVPSNLEGGDTTYTTYIVTYDFSRSHVAHAFVPDDVTVEQDMTATLGNITELVEDPSADGGTVGTPTETEDDGGLLNDTETGDDGLVDDTETDGGSPLFVRVALETDDTDDELTETPTETEDGGLGGDNETTTEGDDGGLGGDNETTTEGDDGGVLGGNNETTTTEGDDGGGLF